MSDKKLTKPAYHTLLRGIANALQTLDDGANTSEREQLRKEAYFAAGDLVVKKKLSRETGYHNQIVSRLANDLDIDIRTLQQSVRFADLYKTPPAAHQIRWSHIRLLIQRSDPRERRFYENQIIKKRLSAALLKVAIAGDHFATASNPSGRFVLPRPENPNFLYRAYLKKIIDGDTLTVYVDLGFHTTREETIRLARINAPELTKKGQNKRATQPKPSSPTS